MEVRTENRESPMFAIVELSADQPAELLEQLIQSSYRASGADSVGLLVNGVDWTALQRSLDPVVMLDRCRSRGVEFLTPSDLTDRPFDGPASCRFVVASSSETRAAFSRLGVPCVPPAEGLRMLDARALTSQPHPAARPPRKTAKRRSIVI